MLLCRLLRDIYHEVVKQIHPDRASNGLDLALRERMMKEANAAFKRGDADTLQRVLEEYRGIVPDGLPRSDTPQQ